MIGTNCLHPLHAHEYKLRSWLITFILSIKESHCVENEIVSRAADALNAGEGCVGGQLGGYGV